MAAYEVFIGRHDGVADRLNGYKLIGPFPNTPGLPIGAKTFIVDATTITFAGSAGDVLTIDQIIAAINVGVSGFARKRTAENAGPAAAYAQDGGHIGAQVLIVLGDGTHHTIDHTGTANALLGISTAVDTDMPAAVAQAKIAGFTLGIYSGHFALIIAP